MPRLGVWVLSALAAAPTPAAETARLRSPDQNIEIRVTVASERLSYEISYKGRPLLLNSRLRLSSMGGGFELARHSMSRNRSSWRPVYGEREEVPDNFNELDLDIEEKLPRADTGVSERLLDTGEKARPERSWRLTFRAYNEGAAFRYTVLRPSAVAIEREETEFRFPDGVMGWEEHGTEGPYARVPVEKIREKCERPLTVEYGDGIYASLTEAAMTDYSRMLPSPAREKPGTLVTELDGPVSGTAPFPTPWRVLIVGERPGDLIERNYLVLNLNPPNAIADTSWIKPGKVIREVTLSTKGGRECVNFAVRHGLQYIEYDAGWYGHEYDEVQDATTVTPDPDRTNKVAGWGGLDLQEVIRYAEAKGIGVLLYVNRRQLERQQEELFPLFARWGVKGVKFGFVRVGEQKWTRWLHAAVKRAAAHRLMVDIHDAYRPTGFSRTYPNLMTQEGIRGNEHMPTAAHNVTLPFTRFVAGAGDATICYYTPRIKTTRAHQLAMSVVVYSPLQFLFWYDRPSAYRGEREVEFFRYVPTVWDETRVLDGAIGEYVVIARRKGKQWYVGALTNGEARRLAIPLDFLEEGRTYRAFVYKDGPAPAKVLVEPRMVRASQTITASLAASGGQAIRLVPMD